MAINRTFESDNNDESLASSQMPIDDSFGSANQETLNGSTSFNSNLDTYFSDEKIPIPDKVNSKILQLNFHFYL